MPRLRLSLIVVHDLLVAALSFPLAVTLRDGGFRLNEMAGYLGAATLGFVVIAAATFQYFGMYRGFWRYASVPDFVPVLKGATLSVLVFTIALFMADRLDMIPRSVPVIQWLLLLVMLCGSRTAYAFYMAQRQADTEGLGRPNWQPILAIGAGDAAALLIQMLRTRPAAFYEVVGILDDRDSYQGRTVHRVPVIGKFADLESCIARLSVHGMRPARLVVTARGDKLDDASLSHLYEVAHRQGIEVQEVAELMQLTGDAAANIHEISLGDLLQKVEIKFFRALKRLLDIVVAIVGLVLTAPLMALVALIVLIDLGAPIIFYQVRPGRGLRIFTLYKFRSMRDGHTEDGRILSDERRQGYVGRLLRRSRLDELPQLFNILVGDMSLIGPRPLLPRDIPYLGDDAAALRFTVRPGLTGWGQVNGNTRLKPDERLALDLYYIRNYSPWLDLKIVVKTLATMVFGERVNDEALRRALA